MEVVVNTVFGPMVIVPTDARIGEELKRKGCWDITEIIDTIKYFERFTTIDPGVILDVGCNVGAWTLPIARRYPDAKIMSFDCQQYLIRCLDKTIDLNKITNVQTYVMALGDCNETVWCGSNVISGLDKDNIVACFNRMKSANRNWKVPEEYDQNNVSDVVVNILLSN